MDLEQLGLILRRIRKEPLHTPSEEASKSSFVPLGRAEIERLLPHRNAMLLIESIESVDRARRTICGTMRLREDDPVLAGHFPGDPIYPGVLLVEAMGQLGLCLIQLTEQDHAAFDGRALPKLRATRIHHAAFFEPVTPGASASLQTAVVEDSGLTIIAAGQVYHRGRLCAVSIHEVYIGNE